MQNGHGHMWLLVTSTFSPATFFAASLLACGCVKDKWINMNHFDITSDIFRSVLCLHCERAEWDFIGTNFRRLVGRRRGGGTIQVLFVVVVFVFLLVSLTMESVAFVFMECVLRLCAYTCSVVDVLCRNASKCCSMVLSVCFLDHLEVMHK